MRAWLFYWLTGCVILGIGWGESTHNCPNDQPPPPERVAVQVLTWPAIFFMGIVGNWPPARCDDGKEFKR